MSTTIHSDRRLPEEFYRNTDVVEVSKLLLGQYLCTEFDGQRCVGKIVETEAYRGPDDKACHAHNNRYTKRSKTMFEAGGIAYVYLCYGIHHLFNVVTALEGMPHAVLIRAIEPVENLPLMLSRRKFAQVKPQLTAGPGVMTKALGISKLHNGLSLYDPDSPIWLSPGEAPLAEEAIIASPRVGIPYAEECIDWPWRFRVKGSKWTSPAK
ncbi:MAG: DNA-3-methyladenine glycosylase [Bacteroidota bacterium]